MEKGVLRMNYSSKLAKAYNIPTVINETPLTKGKTASTYLIHTDSSRKFILKSMDTKEQAFFEYKLNKHIRDKNLNIVSEILTTTNGEPFIQRGDSLFQLQTYVVSENEKAPLQKVLHVYSMLQETLKDFDYDSNRNNRFKLDELWLNFKGNLYENFQSIYEEIYASIEDLTVLDNSQINWIHGDLGAWNILYTAERNICFIDFSEARKGPQYFDLVAIFASYLPRDLKLFDTYTQKFLTTYGVAVNVKEFYQTLELWYVKGILSLLKFDMHLIKEQIFYFYNIIKCIKSLKTHNLCN
jgi:Ser/Thr protein kinase RdoA (MazF antagonist)